MVYVAKHLPICTDITALAWARQHLSGHQLQLSKMQQTRRKLLAAVVTAGATSISGCITDAEMPNVFDDGKPRVTFSGNVSTDEPLLSDVVISTDMTYPSHYSTIVASKKEARRIRWEYIRNDEPTLVSNLERADLESGVLAFFGMVLPADKQLQPVSTSFRDGKLYAEYRIDHRSSASSKLQINTQIKEVKLGTNPDSLEPSVHF